jgi:hypothetical protein
MATPARRPLDEGGPSRVVRERIYVGIDVGYREHVVAAVPLPLFNPRTLSACISLRALLDPQPIWAT